MGLTVSLFGNSIYYPLGGGHQWVAMNWLLGLKSIGCRIVWLEGIKPDDSVETSCGLVSKLKDRLRPYGLEDELALCGWDGSALPAEVTHGTLPFERATAESDLILNLGYNVSESVVTRFRRRVLVDIDPGLLQVWLSLGYIHPAKHDVYFTIGETVGRPGSRIPDVGIPFVYTPPCVALDWWPVTPAAPAAPFTTVTQWYTEDWIAFNGESYCNTKREGFLPYRDLPKLTRQRLELAVNFGPAMEEERQEWLKAGWRFRAPADASSTPQAYQRFIASSRGEFSCCKPSCVRLQNAWISDRTLCYLASGKPCVLEHTGPSRFLPDDAGLFRFTSPGQAAQYLDRVAEDYDHQGRLARALAEEYFDARKVLPRLLERAIA